MSRLQVERESDKKAQEIDVLKALLAKLQKYSNEGNNAIPPDLTTNRDFGGSGKKVRCLQSMLANLIC